MQPDQEADIIRTCPAAVGQRRRHSDSGHSFARLRLQASLAEEAVPRWQKGMGAMEEVLRRWMRQTEEEVRQRQQGLVALLSASGLADLPLTRA